MNDLAVLVIGPIGEGLSKTANLILGQQAFNENDAEMQSAQTLATADNDTMRVIDLPLLSFDGPNLEQAFMHALTQLTNTVALIGQRKVACFVCKSAMVTRLEAPLVQMLQCIRQSLQISDVFFLATYADRLTEEAKQKKLLQFQNELPNLLLEHKIAVKGSIERDLDGRFMSHPTVKQFLLQAQPLAASHETGLFNFWRGLYFDSQLKVHRDYLQKENQRNGQDFIKATMATSNTIKAIQQEYKQKFATKFESANCKPMISSLINGTFTRSMLPEMRLLDIQLVEKEEEKHNPVPSDAGNLINIYSEFKQQEANQREQFIDQQQQEFLRIMAQNEKEQLMLILQQQKEFEEEEFEQQKQREVFRQQVLRQQEYSQKQQEMMLTHTMQQIEKQRRESEQAQRAFEEQRKLLIQQDEIRLRQMQEQELKKKKKSNKNNKKAQGYENDYEEEPGIFRKFIGNLFQSGSNR